MAQYRTEELLIVREGKTFSNISSRFTNGKTKNEKEKKRRVDEKSNNLDHVLYAEAFQPFPGFSFVNVWIMDERRRGKAKGSVIIAVCCFQS